MKIIGKGHIYVVLWPQGQAYGKGNMVDESARLQVGTGRNRFKGTYRGAYAAFHKGRNPGDGRSDPGLAAKEQPVEIRPVIRAIRWLILVVGAGWYKYNG